MQTISVMAMVVRTLGILRRPCFSMMFGMSIAMTTAATSEKEKLACSPLALKMPSQNSARLASTPSTAPQMRWARFQVLSSILAM